MHFSGMHSTGIAAVWHLQDCADDGASSQKPASEQHRRHVQQDSSSVLHMPPVLFTGWLLTGSFIISRTKKERKQQNSMPFGVITGAPGYNQQQPNAKHDPEKPSIMLGKRKVPSMNRTSAAWCTECCSATSVNTKQQAQCCGAMLSHAL